MKFRRFTKVCVLWPLRASFALMLVRWRPCFSMTDPYAVALSGAPGGWLGWRHFRVTNGVARSHCCFEPILPKRPKSHNQNFDPRRAFVDNLERVLHDVTTGEAQRDISARLKSCKLLTPLWFLRGLQKQCFLDLRIKLVRLWATEPEVVEFVAREQRRRWVKIATCEVVAKLFQNGSSKIALPLGRCRICFFLLSMGGLHPAIAGPLRY